MIYRAIAGRCIAEGDSNTDTGVGYLSVSAALKEPLLWMSFAFEARGIKEGWLQRIAVPAALEPEGFGATYGPDGMPRFATNLGAKIAA